MERPSLPRLVARTGNRPTLPPSPTARVEGSEAVLTERMFDPEVRVSGDLAMVWTPYDFYVGDEFSHCGADAVLLSRSGDSWTIVALSWTRLQPPECELHPDGPPE